MKRNTNISLKERRVFTIEDLRGADFASSPFDTSQNRATQMLNLIKENGVTQKRSGWRTEYCVDNKKKILGMYEYNGSLLVMTESCLYVYTDPFTEGVSVKKLNFENKASVAEFFYNSGRCYILTGADLLVYDGTSLKQRSDFEKGYGCYIPTTSINYGTEIKTLDSVNLLTRWRKNECNNQSGTNTEYTEYLLDGGVDTDTPGEGWQTDVYWVNQTTGEKLDVFSDPSSFLDYVSGNEYQNQVVEVGGNVRGRYLDGEGKWHNLYSVNSEENKNEILLYADDMVAYSYGKDSDGDGFDIFDDADIIVDVYGAVKVGSIINNDDMKGSILNFTKSHSTIELEFKASKETATDDDVHKYMFGTLFGIGGNNDRLFIGGNPANPNVVRFSALDNFSYFPDNQAVILGSANVPIVGFLRLNDGTLAAMKQKNSNESTIYYLADGGYDTKYDKNGEIERMTPQFPVTSGAVGEGGVSNAANCNFYGDNILLSENGVFGVVVPDNAATKVRYTKERSYFISSVFKGKELSGAVACVHNNRYYLCMDGMCYVADADYKCYRENDADTSYNYEWWVWDNIPATAILSIGTRLIFGTDDGKICVFDKEYTDRNKECLQAGDLTIYDGYVVMNEELGIGLYADTHTLKFSKESLYGFIANMISIGGELKCSDDKQLSGMYEGMCVELFSSDLEAEAYVGGFQISEIDRGEGTVKLKNPDTDQEWIWTGESDVLFDVYIDLSNIELRFVKREDGAGFDVIRPGTNDIIGLKLMNTETPIYLTKTIPVRARWETPYFDMGTNLMGKTIHSFAVTCESGGGVPLRVGYETRRVRGTIAARSPASFSFEDFSFENMTFEDGFAASHTIRRTIRNFNYIRFCFSHNGASGCAIHNMSAVYKINKRLVSEIRGTLTSTIE